MPVVKTECPISLKEFQTAAKPIDINLGGQTVQAVPRPFEKGSFGWYFNKKVDMDVGGKPCVVQMQVLCTVVGSKEAPRE